MERHPIDMIHSWYLKGYGNNFWENPRVQNLTIKWKQYTLPYYALGWEKEFIEETEMNRIVKMVSHIKTQEAEGFDSLSTKHKKQVLILKFEELVSNPEENLEKICIFLNSDKTNYTPITILKEKERFPELLNKKERLKKQNEINKLSSGDSFNLLKKMIKKYDSNELY